MTVRKSRKVTMTRYFEQNRGKILFQNAQYRDEIRLEMIEAYGGKCGHCDEADPLVLVLDHINNDPEPEYEVCGKSARGGYTLYRKLKKQNWPKERFQLLCQNCNMKKEHIRRRNTMVEKYGPAPAKAQPLTRGEARSKSDKSSNNTSGFKGVFWDNNREKWFARLVVNGKQKVFGRHDNIQDAAKAIRAACIELFGSTYKPLSDEEIERIALELHPPIKITASADEMGL